MLQSRTRSLFRLLLWCFLLSLLLLPKASTGAWFESSRANRSGGNFELGTSVSEGDRDAPRQTNFSARIECATNDIEHKEHDDEGEDEEGERPHIHVASWRQEEVGIFITIILFVVLSGLAKVGFHHAHFLSSRVPESCLLFIVGIAMGAIIKALDGLGADIDFPEFTPELFFDFLLPPIILEASYSLYDRAFFDNLSTILVMAVIGTAFNFLLIGFLLYLVFYLGAMGTIRGPFQTGDGLDGLYDLGLTEILVFASLISAVDPVAVLAIFQEVGVNPDLYFLVFGESLLNDGVAVVFYNMMNGFAEISSSGHEVEYMDILLGCISFLTVALGGLSIGIVIGMLTALITKTTTEVRVVEPLALFGMAYLAYMTAELFHFSGIISLIGCGLIQAHYALKNISKNSYTTVKYFIKMLSSTSDCIIFLYLGMEILAGDHFWHTGFVVWTISFTLICRFLGVYGLVFLANRRRVKKINLQEQFIMAYGGLRGAVGFSLVEMINSKVVPPQKMFVTCTLAVVVFTIFFQGGTIKWLVNLLDIDKATDEQKLITEEVNDNVMGHLVAGMEVISGKRGSMHFGAMLEKLDENFLKKWFLNRDNNHELAKLYEELAISDHLMNLYGASALMDPATVNKVNQLDEVSYLGSAIDFSIDQAPGFGIEHLRHLSAAGDTLGGDFAAAVSGDAAEGLQLPSRQPSRRKRTISSSSAILSPIMSLRRASVQVGSLDKERHESGDSHSVHVGIMSRPQSMRNRKVSRDILVSAFRQNPYNRLHQKYNRNLIDDDDQELETHLRKRHLVARRIGQMHALQLNANANFQLNANNAAMQSPSSPINDDMCYDFTSPANQQPAPEAEQTRTRHRSLIHPDGLKDALTRVPSAPNTAAAIAAAHLSVLGNGISRIRSISLSSDRVRKFSSSSSDQASASGAGAGAAAKATLAADPTFRRRKLSPVPPTPAPFESSWFGDDVEADGALTPPEAAVAAGAEKSAETPAPNITVTRMMSNELTKVEEENEDSSWKKLSSKKSRSSLPRGDEDENKGAGGEGGKKTTQL